MKSSKRQFKNYCRLFSILIVTQKAHDIENFEMWSHDFSDFCWFFFSA